MEKGKTKHRKIHQRLNYITPFRGDGGLRQTVAEAQMEVDKWSSSYKIQNLDLANMTGSGNNTSY